MQRFRAVWRVHVSVDLEVLPVKFPFVLQLGLTAFLSALPRQGEFQLLTAFVPFGLYRRIAPVTVAELRGRGGAVQLVDRARWVDFESRNLEALRLTLARRRSRGSRVDNGSGHPHAHRVAAACSSRVLAVPAALL